MDDDERLHRLAMIHRRMQEISEMEAATVMVKGLAASGIFEAERDKWIEETERLLDERNA